MSDGIGPRSLCPYCLTLPGEAHMHHCPRVAVDPTDQKGATNE